MNNHTPGAWKYIKNEDGTFSVIPLGSVNFKAGFATNLIAKVFSEGIIDPEANARLIASAPEIYQALHFETEALAATRDFMHVKGLDTQELGEIINVADEIFRKIDSIEGD